MATEPPDDVRTTELIGGVEQRELVLVEHDPRWADRFEIERARIAAALGPAAFGIEHIGSTAVPGLAAKPIVDVLVTVARIADEDTYLPQLVDAGYRLRTREPGHRLLRTPELDVHVHVLQVGAEAAAAYLDLRDRLRESAEARRRYTAVKQAVIATGVTDMNAYSDGKAGVIAAIRAGHYAPTDPREDGAMSTPSGGPAALAAWHAVASSQDPHGLDALLADDVVFRSPAVYAPQPGKAITTAYLRAALVVLGPTLRYVRQWTDERSAVLEFEADLDGVFVQGIDMIDWNEQDLITAFTVIVRPVRGLQALIERMAAELTR